MLVKDMLTLVERRAMEVDTKMTYPDRPTIQQFLTFELQHLSSLEEWDFLCVHANPLVMTQTGTREYRLPQNFGTNFIRAAEDEFTGYSEDVYYMCKLDDGQTESFLRYKSPARFFGRNLRGEQNSRPTDYTISVTRGGGSEIHLAPKPDANGSVGYYLIRGVYIPTDWEINDETEVPPLPGNNTYLMNRILATVFQNTDLQALYDQKADRDLAALYMIYARNRRVRMRPGDIRNYDLYAQ